MTKNPLYNSLIAYIYIILIVFIMNWASNTQAVDSSLIMPIIIISLFTLSAAVMAYIFGYKPVVLYFDNKKNEAIKLFVNTVIIFGSITFGSILIYLLFTTYLV